MNGGLKGSGGWFKLHYDRILAVVMLAALGFSLVYLVVRIGMIRRTQLEHMQRIDNYQPEYPEASPVDSAPYKEAMAALQSPRQLPAWTNTYAIFVPETRVWCWDCRSPILYDAMVCTYCGAQQPKIRARDPLWDSDLDGIPDLWERKFGMDPTDPSDVHTDRDGDGFSNLIEFNSDPKTNLEDLQKKHGTDVNDPEDHPPPPGLLVVTDIHGEPFDLQYKGEITLPDKSLKFQVNIKGTKTRLVRLGETVEGFKVLKHEPRRVKDPSTGMSRDKSILTLQRGKKIIELVKLEPVPYTEYTAELTFTLDGSVYSVKPMGIFELQGKRYGVKKIDSDNQTVVIVRSPDGKVFTVGRAPETGP